MAVIFQAGFLLFWLTGWTVGGVFAWTAFLGRGAAVGASIVWLVLTCAFAFTAMFGCPGADCWFAFWVPFTIFLRFARIKQIQSAISKLSSKMHKLGLRSKYYAQYIINSCMGIQPDDDENTLTMISVSVYLASGEELLLGAKVLSQDYVQVLRELVEAHPIVPQCGRVQLIVGTDALEDDMRICDAGIDDGSSLTAFILQDLEQPPKEDQEQPGAAIPTPAFARCFLAVWLCGWIAGEVAVSMALQKLLLCD